MAYFCGTHTGSVNSWLLVAESSPFGAHINYPARDNTHNVICYTSGHNPYGKQWCILITHNLHNTIVTAHTCPLQLGRIQDKSCRQHDNLLPGRRWDVWDTLLPWSICSLPFGILKSYNCGVQYSVCHLSRGPFILAARVVIVLFLPSP